MSKSRLELTDSRFIPALQKQTQHLEKLECRSGLRKATYAIEYPSTSANQFSIDVDTLK